MKKRSIFYILFAFFIMFGLKSNVFAVEESASCYYVKDEDPNTYIYLLDLTFRPELIRIVDNNKFTFTKVMGNVNILTMSCPEKIYYSDEISEWSLESEKATYSYSYIPAEVRTYMFMGGKTVKGPGSFSGTFNAYAGNITVVVSENLSFKYCMGLDCSVSIDYNTYKPIVDSNQDYSCSDEQYTEISLLTGIEEDKLKDFDYCNIKLITTNSGEAINDFESYTTICGFFKPDGKLFPLVKNLYRIFKIAIPVLVAILTIVEFIKVLFSGEDKTMKDAFKATTTRFILLAIVIFLPILVEFIIKLSGMSEDCLQYFVN